jgi:predicted Rossmann-fold nucleotide-binding protein
MNKDLKVFVCGGSSIVSPEFYTEAYNIGKLIANLGYEYIQGGVVERKTIMGESYYGYIENGGNKTYVMTRVTFTDELDEYKDEFEKFKEVDDIGDLLKEQFLYSDVSIIMPGGTGTLMELLGYIEERYDYPESKNKVIVYNKEINGKGFFDNILDQIELSRKCDFIKEDVINDCFTIVNNYDELIKEIENL